MGKLTARQAATLAPGKYNDGAGLWLAVSKTGARKWVLRVVLRGKRREMGLGAFPGTSLMEARAKAVRARSQVAEGIDPVEARHRVEATVPTFTMAAAAYIRSRRHEWANRKHARQWVSTLKCYARPVIGPEPVDAIGTEHVLAVLKPIWLSKTETAKRVQGRIENILDFAAARQWRGPVNPARWRGHLDKLLSSPTKLKRQRNGGTTRHHPAMPYTLAPDFMVELRARDSVSALAIEFLILTATRTGEALGATWSEIDPDARVWTIPAARMKAGREHRVPLSAAALEVLERLPRVAGNDHLFVGARHGRPLSNMALLQLMRGMGYGVGGERGDYVPHGFRSSFRDWAGEVSAFPANVAEAALAHVIGDKTEAAYARGTLFAKRARMMQEWADWCGKGTEDNVRAIRGTAQDDVSGSG